MPSMSVMDCSLQERIETCGQCGRTLPLAKPVPGQLAIRWICKGCSASYQAVLAVDSLAEALDHVRPAGLVFDRKKLVHPPGAIANFVKKAVGETKPDNERRGVPRYRLVVPAIALPMDQRLRPVDDPFAALTRNISKSGLCLAHTRAVRAELLAVELSDLEGETMQLVMRLLRCRPTNRFYEIAGAFLVRMASSAAPPESDRR
jgi:hypothetical protein